MRKSRRRLASFPAMSAHELAYDALRGPQKRLHKLLERSEDELETTRNQRKARRVADACALMHE